MNESPNQPAVPGSPLPSLELIIPVFNEEAVLPALFERFASVLSPAALHQARLSHVHFLFIDDGSSDQTAPIVAARIRSGWPGTLIRLSRNFGHQSALTAGLDHADGDLVAILDSDLQDPPELILDMVSRIHEGYDVVYGERRSRTEPWFKKAAYWIFYRFYRLVSEVPVPMDAGDFCLMKREVVVALRQLPEKLRFHRGLRSWVGFRQTALPYDRPGRRAGRSKYKLSSLYALATNGIASLSIRPIQITQGVLFISLILMTGSIGIAVLKMPHSDVSYPVLRSLLITQMLVAITASLNIISLYVLGAYIGRTYLEVKARPPYIIVETIGATAQSERQ